MLIWKQEVYYDTRDESALENNGNSITFSADNNNRISF